MLLLKIFGLIYWSSLCYAVAPLSDYGMVVSLSPSFFYYGGLNVFQGDINTYPQQDYVYPGYFSFGDDTDVVAMKSDPTRNRLIYTNALNQNVMSLDHFSTWLNDSMIPRVIHKGLSDTFHGRIAYDWLTGNIYWTDNKYNWIAIQNADHMDPSSFKILVHEGVIAPGGITIDPISRHLFWAEHGASRTVIIRSDLEGKNWATIVTGLDWVPDIIADTSTRTLYWIDNNRNAIEKCSYDGSNRRVVYRSTDIEIAMSSLTLYKNYLCITEYMEEYVGCVDKTTGTVIWSDYVYDGYPWAMDMYSIQLHQQESHPCQNYGCSDICVNVNGGAKCLCRDGYEVDPNNAQNCLEKNFGKKILFSNGSDVCMFEIRALTGHSTDMVDSNSSNCIFKWNGTVEHLAVDVRRTALFFYDGSNPDNRGIILYNTTTGMSTKWAATALVSGLQYDWIGKDLYWSYIDGNEGGITVASTLQRNQERTLFRNLPKPKNLVIYPHGRMIFWIEGTPNMYKIKSYSYGTSPGTSVVLDHASLENPMALCYNDIHDRLYYVDRGYLHSVAKNGTSLDSPLQNVHSDKLLLCYKDYAAHSSGTDDITSRNIYDSTSAKTYTIDISAYGTINSMVVYDIDSQRTEKNPCETNNGDCQHICIPTSSTQRQCKCSFGYVLAPDNTKCKTNIKTNNFALTVDFTHGEIYQVDINNGSNINAIDLPRPAYPVAAVYSDQHIYWSDYQTDKLHRSNMDGSNTSTVYNLDGHICFSLTVDPSTGNVYYAGVPYAGKSYTYIGVVHPSNMKHKTLFDEDKQLEIVGSIALYPSKGYLYYIDQGFYLYSGSIRRSKMDGSFDELVKWYGLTQPTSIAIDYIADKIFWTDFYEDKIYTSDLEGTFMDPLYYDVNVALAHIAVGGSNVYYTATKKEKVTRINKVSGVADIWMQNEPEMGRLETLSVYMDSSKIPVHQTCSRNNGGCSTFCFPTGPGKRSCGCEDGSELLPDLKTCDTVLYCPMTFQKGKLDSACMPYINNTCNFTCNDGFRRSTGTLLRCIVNPKIPHAVKWEVDIDSLCQALPPGKTTPSPTMAPQGPGVAAGQTQTQTENGISTPTFAAVVVVLILIFLLVILGLLFIMYRRRGSEMFAHAKFVNAPNVPQMSDNTPRVDSAYDNIVDQKVAHQQNTTNAATASSDGLENPLYKAKNPPPTNENMNQNTYTTIEISKF